MKYQNILSKNSFLIPEVKDMLMHNDKNLIDLDTTTEYDSDEKSDSDKSSEDAEYKKN